MNEARYASVGLSRKWEAREAGREVARTAIKDLDFPPKFFLLFSTIHYEKYGGFEELLKGVYDVLPPDTPLIGGTVAGFINNYGCFTRGVTALAVFHPKMNVAIGVGRNTRRNPRRAAGECARQISKQLERNYKANLVLDILPGPRRPSIFGKTLPIVIKSGLLAALGPKYLDFSVKYFQKGQGLEEEIVRYLSEYLDDYIIFGGSSADNNDLINNYQFFYENVDEESLVAIGINTDLNLDFAHSDGLVPTGIKFNVTKTAQGSKIVKELNWRPAANVFFETIGVPLDKLDDRLLRITFFYPLAVKTIDGYLCPNAVGAVIKGYIAFNHSIEKKELELLTTSGKLLISSVDYAVKSIAIKKPKFGFMISCLARLETLGINIFRVREKLVEYFKEKPFLLIYSAGENIRLLNEEPHHFNETFNMLVATDENESA